MFAGWVFGNSLLQCFGRTDGGFVHHQDGSLTIKLDTPDGKYSLRSIAEDDIPFEQELFANPIAMEKYADGKPRAKDATERRIRESWMPRFQRGQPHGPFVIYDEVTGNRVGHIVAGEGNEPGLAEVGYIILPEYWGKGITTAAMSVIVNQWAPHVRKTGLGGDTRYKCFGGQAVHQIEATASPANAGSWKVLVKNRFKARAKFDIEVNVDIAKEKLGKEKFWEDFEKELIQRYFSDGSIDSSKYVRILDPEGNPRTVKYDPRFSRIKYFFEHTLQI
eukprot:m.38638 g.38638  ORF g.38638 m.38638 type:complete len:277 (+) comp9457_c1_seq1:199-1029(+)